MALPAHEDISVNRTKGFVTKQDIDLFNQWMKSLNEFVIPFEHKTKNCDTVNLVQTGHVIETTIDLLNEEILRMLRWAKKDQSEDTDKLAKNFKDVRDKYKKSLKDLETDCLCKRKEEVKQ